jgi:plasmid stabilization system protein ParE
LGAVTAHPEIGAEAVGESGIRRVLVTRFPYQIVYRYDSTEVVILAFAHLKRRPGFWKHRE